MAAELPKWSTTAQAEEQKHEKAKTKSMRRKEQKKRRLARIAEAKLAQTMMEMDKQIGEIQVEMQKLIEAEKQKSERFLSIARKYYGMWKRLNEKFQQESAWKSQSSQMKAFKSNVSVYIFPSSRCTQIAIQATFISIRIAF